MNIDGNEANNFESPCSLVGYAGLVDGDRLGRFLGAKQGGVFGYSAENLCMH